MGGLVVVEVVGVGRGRVKENGRGWAKCQGGVEGGGGVGVDRRGGAEGGKSCSPR